MINESHMYLIMAIIAAAILVIPVSISALQSISLGIPFVDAGSKEPQSESEDLSDSSGTENQPPDIESEDSDTADRESEETSDTDTNESDVTPSEDTSNTTSSTPPPESITMSPSDLIPDNQTSNQTEGESNATLTVQEKLAKGIIPDTKIEFPYTVKVKFDSIYVQDTHDPGIPGFTTSSDGEYDLYAYVQGVLIGLTDRSWEGTCGGSGNPLPCGLGDVSHGERVYFTPSAEVTVQIPGTLPLSIFTVGHEVDRCGRINPSENIQEKLFYVLQKPQDTWLDSIDGFQNQINTIGCGNAGPGDIFVDENEVLGTLSKFYDPPGYGAGAHEECDEDCDFILKYTITVTPPPGIQSKPGTFNTNNLSSTKNFSSTNNFSSQLNNDFSAKSLAP